MPSVAAGEDALSGYARKSGGSGAALVRFRPQLCDPIQLKISELLCLVP